MHCTALLCVISRDELVQIKRQDRQKRGRDARAFETFVPKSNFLLCGTGLTGVVVGGLSSQFICICHTWATRLPSSSHSCPLSGPDGDACCHPIPICKLPSEPACIPFIVCRHVAGVGAAVRCPVTAAAQESGRPAVGMSSGLMFYQTSDELTSCLSSTIYSLLRHARTLSGFE